MHKVRDIRLQNFTNDHLFFFEYLSIFPEGEMPEITKVNQHKGVVTISIRLSDTDHREILNYIKNNR